MRKRTVWRKVTTPKGDVLEVSNTSKVRDPKTKKEYGISYPEDRPPMITVRSVNGGWVPYTVHRLVAMAFIENPENKSQVCFIDGNKHNIALENLIWSTPSESMHRVWDKRHNS